MEQPTGEQLHHPLANYQFSYDELRVLRECNKESFFQRSVPLSIGFGVTTYFGINRGFFKPNPRFGAVPKVVVAVIFGYFIGKFSYQQKCAEKLMQLPNSKLAEVLRERSKNRSLVGSFAPDQKLGVGIAIAPFTSSTPDDGTFDREHRPTLEGLDDIYRPTLDSPSTYFETDLPLEQSRTKLTYEELRKKNREAYNQKQENTLHRPLPAEAPLTDKSSEALPKNIGQQYKGKTNKYGDIWTE